MKIKDKSLIMKALKGIGIAIVVLLLLLFLLPTVFPKALTKKVKAFANKKLNGELSF